jgi:hypothetical protein
MDAIPCRIDATRSSIGACRLLSRCRTDVFDDCAVPCLFVDIVKLPLKPPPLCVAWLDEADEVLKAIPPPDHNPSANDEGAGKSFCHMEAEARVSDGD